MLLWRSTLIKVASPDWLGTVGATKECVRLGCVLANSKSALAIKSMSGVVGGMTSSLPINSGPVHQRAESTSSLAPKPLEGRSAGFRIPGQ